MANRLIWKDIPISQTEVCLSKCLRCGQTFRWKNIGDIWTFTLSDRIVLLRQYENLIKFSWIEQNHSTQDNMSSLELEKETFNFVLDYFNTGIKLNDLYDQWKEADKLYNIGINKSVFDNYDGVRILRQDPWETLVSFICSSNNNVKRISKMCDTLCNEFGRYINEFGGVKHYSFPDAAKLCDPSVELRLRVLGFGYRAKYIHKTACFFGKAVAPQDRLRELYSLRLRDYPTAFEYLLQLHGVGPKVADCICLMALDKHNVVPVDTHVYQIAVRDYKFKSKKGMKSLNRKEYYAIADHFRKIFGDFAGWAQSILFTSDLRDLTNGVNKDNLQLDDTYISNSETYTLSKRSLEILEGFSARKLIKTEQ